MEPQYKVLSEFLDINTRPYLIFGKYWCKWWHFYNAYNWFSGFYSFHSGWSKWGHECKVSKGGCNQQECFFATIESRKSYRIKHVKLLANQCNVQSNVFLAGPNPDEFILPVKADTIDITCKSRLCILWLSEIHGEVIWASTAADSTRSSTDEYMPHKRSSTTWSPSHCKQFVQIWVSLC